VLLDHPVLQEIAEKYGKSAAQVILRWDLQNGVITSFISSADSSKSKTFAFSSIRCFLVDFGMVMTPFCRVGPDPDNFDF
jgi:hypothetical protein